MRRRAASCDSCSECCRPAIASPTSAPEARCSRSPRRSSARARVAAIELDPDAIGNAEENVVRNGVADRVTVIEGDAPLLLPLVAPVDVVTANIISSVLIELLPAIARVAHRGRHAILSGISVAEREMMIQCARDAGWRVVAEDHEDDWWSATIARR